MEKGNKKISDFKKNDLGIILFQKHSVKLFAEDIMLKEFSNKLTLLGTLVIVIVLQIDA